MPASPPTHGAGNLRASGGSLMGDGIAVALKKLRNLPDPGVAIRKLVVLTGGQTNDEEYCYKLAEQTAIPFMLGGIGKAG